MPSKRRRFNARFSPGRIKKMMQKDEDVGKVAAPVPVMLSRALELFLGQLLTGASQVTEARNAKTMTAVHLRECIETEPQFDFLKDLVASVPDATRETAAEKESSDQVDHAENMAVKPTRGRDIIKVTGRRGRKPGRGRKSGGGEEATCSSSTSSKVKAGMKRKRPDGESEYDNGDSDDSVCTDEEEEVEKGEAQTSTSLQAEPVCSKTTSPESLSNVEAAGPQGYSVNCKQPVDS